jgi:hypothetical protein
MKKTVLISVILIFNLIIKAQTNLVPNPSFEDTVSCPTGAAEIEKAVGWTQNGSSDYFNICGYTGSVGVPYTFGGFQQPASGNAFAGICTYYSLISNYRENIAHQLSSSLSIGTKYYVSFKTNLSLGSAGDANCATDKIGAMFSTVAFTGFYWVITNNPQVYSNTTITDTLSWSKVFGSFVADSAYNHIVIGNFFDDINTDTTKVYSTSADKAYYFIDDICVSTDSLFALNYIPTRINKKSSSYLFSIYPNPAKNHVTINNPLIKNIAITISDTMGNQLFRAEDIYESKYQVDLTNFNPGMFLISITSDNSLFNYKLIKQ